MRLLQVSKNIEISEQVYNKEYKNYETLAISN